MIRGRRKLALACGFVLLTLVAGASYNSFRNWVLNRDHPAPGRIYTVDGFAMHMYCIGSGAPTVILESGLGNDWLIWQKIQNQISASNRVCSYDRAGIGWSAARDGSRGALAIARQLRELLRAGNVRGPLLLVGHSAGGLYARAFAGLFSAEVAGLILVDSSSPEAFHVLPSPALRQKLIAERHRQAPWLYFKVATGISRLFEDYCNPNTSQRIPAVQDLARAEDCRASYMNSWLGEWDEFESSAEQVASLSCCNSIPLVVVSADPGPDGKARQTGQAKWDLVQRRLTHLSTRSMRIIARNSGHYVMVDRPDVVLAAIAIVNDELHGLSDGIQIGQIEWR